MSDINANVVVSMPSQQFTLARAFKAAANGKIYVGVIDTDPTLPANQIQVYLENEDASIVPVSQPITINDGGFPVYNGQVSKFVTTQGHSMTVLDGQGVQQFYFPNVLKYDPDRFKQQLSDANDVNLGDALIGVKSPVAGSQPYTQHEKNFEHLHAVNDFNLIGDKVSDNALKLQAAMDAAASSKKKLILPAGTYLINRYISIPSGLHLEGEIGAEIYLSPGMQTGDSFGGIARAIYAIDKSNITIENVRFFTSDDVATQSLTIGLLRCDKILLSNCTFEEFGSENYYAQGFIAFQTTNVHVDGCVFNKCSGDGMALSNNCLYFSVRNSTFSNNGDWGLALVENSSYGIVEGNIFLNNKSTATGVDRSSFVQFVGNSMYNNEHGVRVCEFAVSSDKCEHITVVGNNMKLNNYGISFENMKAPYASFAAIGNTIDGSNQQAIQVVNTAQGVICGNSIYSSANAAILLQNNSASKTTGLVSISGNNIMSCIYGIQEILSSGNLAFNSIGANNIQGATTQNISVTSNTQYVDASTRNYITLSHAPAVPLGITTASAAAGPYDVPEKAQGFWTINIGGVDKKVPYYN